LAEGLALESAQHAAFVRSACPDDPALQGELESLLAAAAADGTLLDEPPSEQILDALAERSARGWIGRSLGAWRLLSLIARGGMGEVYRAERADGQYEQQVAVKVMREGDDQAHWLARFDAERRILASLDHPHLAKLLDAGVTPEGAPYFVMELVDGVPIDAYCERERLPVEGRLQLFRTVCQVVHYAHGQGVIHRDLKPSNILVTHDGIVKLVDFGIAKRVQAELRSGADDRTRTTQRVLTPEYASPEQIRGVALTPASDIYALGVVLYRLLTRASPYGDAASDSYALTRAICETEPPRPSQALAAAEPDSRGRRRRLQGDLDAVVLMALRKEPERRYASAEAFADDVFRHLEGLPVQARRGAWSYRAGRFLLRHRAATGAVLVANIALVAGIALATWQAIEAHRQRERAERHFAGVRKLANTLMVEVHEAIRTLPGSTPARKLLVQNALTYLQQLGSEARDDAALQIELAGGYRQIGDIQGRPFTPNIGDPAGAKASYERALAMTRPLIVPARAADKTYRDAQQEFAWTAQRLGALLGATDKFGEAQAVLRDGIAVVDDLAAADRTQRKRQLLRATLHGQLSQVQFFAGEIDAYMKNSAFAAAQLETLVAQDPNDRDTALSLNNNYSTRGEYLIQRDRKRESAQLALDDFRKGLAAIQPLHAKNPNDTSLIRPVAIAHDSIGWCLLRLGRPQEAAGEHRRAIELLTPASQRDPSNVQFRAEIAGFHGALSEALLAGGDASGALSAATAALSGYDALPAGMREDNYTRYRHGLAHYQLALAMQARGDRGGACGHLQQVLPVFAKFEADHNDIAAGLPGVKEVRQAMSGCP
jgi:eukaryotic-like serine/threonine-protein kinase